VCLVIASPTLSITSHTRNLNRHHIYGAGGSFTLGVT
jgi:hypothetical protein